MPAGYMDLESIPPFFIRPEAPNSSPLPWSRRLIPVVLFAAALLLLLSERCARGIRRLRQDRSYRTRVAAGLTIFLFALGVRNTDINGAGETCDEWAYAMAGQIYVSNTAWVFSKYVLEQQR